MKRNILRALPLALMASISVTAHADIETAITKEPEEKSQSVDLGGYEKHHRVIHDKSTKLQKSHKSMAETPDFDYSINLKIPNVMDETYLASTSDLNRTSEFHERIIILEENKAVRIKIHGKIFVNLDGVATLEVRTDTNKPKRESIKIFSKEITESEQITIHLIDDIKADLTFNI